MFLPTLDDQVAGFDAGILQTRLGVELAFVVTDEAFFVAPFGGIGESLVIEFVGPN